ncbi:MAG TPA: hypothetical protein VKV26_12170 [Dehalococcoidia bacterium]|nr:hypothetical protein [Dehalococcoidia bacterium]
MSTTPAAPAGHESPDYLVDTRPRAIRGLVIGLLISIVFWCLVLLVLLFLGVI